MSDFLTKHILDTLCGQTPKILLEIFDMGLGWESWTQVELGLSMTRTAASEPRRFKFQREARVYEPQHKGEVLIWDFTIEETRDHIGKTTRLLQCAELKCQIKTESLANFVARVREDFHKVMFVGPKEEWVASADYVTTCVAAITVDFAKDGKVEDAMQLLTSLVGASDPRVHCISSDRVIRLWLWKCFEKVWSRPATD